MSYRYLTKKEIKPVRSIISGLITKLVSDLKREEKISSQFMLIGSGARNMITINNEKNIIDFDYNLKILRWGNNKLTSIDTLNTKQKSLLKQKIMDAMNKVFYKWNLKYVSDSTSVITTKPFEVERQKIFIDLAIIYENDDRIYRLIHDKKGNTNDEYRFEEVKNIDKKYKDKIRDLKQNHKWNNVRDEYLKLKDINSKLKAKNQSDKQSISIYAEAISNISNSSSM